MPFESSICETQWPRFWFCSLPERWWDFRVMALQYNDASQEMEVILFYVLGVLCVYRCTMATPLKRWRYDGVHSPEMASTDNGRDMIHGFKVLLWQCVDFDHKLGLKSNIDAKDNLKIEKHAKRLNSAEMAATYNYNMGWIRYTGSRLRWFSWQGVDIDD